MPEIVSRRLHCDECDGESDFLSQLGMTVVGCERVPGLAGQCDLRFFDPRLVPADAVAAGAGPAAVGTVATPAAASSVASLPALTATQVRSCKAIVNLFETSSVVGRYGQVTVLEGDTGQLTFGRSQTTLGSGNLARLIARYTDNPAARFAAALRPFLARMATRDVALNRHEHLKNILRASADDPVMRDVQDAFFDATYWDPAEAACRRLGIGTPLGVAVVYDSHVHGSWRLLRDRTVAAAGTPAAAGERAWIERYIALRQHWLATHGNPLLRQTVYRMEAFARLVELGAWGLELPLVVRGEEISLSTLSALPPDAFDGPQPGSRSLGLQSPMQRGLDVRLVQLALSARGLDLRADAVFGKGSRDAVTTFQRDQGLPVTGTLDPESVARLAAA